MEFRWTNNPYRGKLWCHWSI